MTSGGPPQGFTTVLARLGLFKASFSMTEAGRRHEAPRRRSFSCEGPRKYKPTIPQIHPKSSGGRGKGGLFVLACSAVSPFTPPSHIILKHRDGVSHPSASRIQKKKINFPPSTPCAGCDDQFHSFSPQGFGHLSPELRVALFLSSLMSSGRIPIYFQPSITCI